jgi:hypothetical protein
MINLASHRMRLGLKTLVNILCTCCSGAKSQLRVREVVAFTLTLFRLGIPCARAAMGRCALSHVARFAPAKFLLHHHPTSGTTTKTFKDAKRMLPSRGIEPRPHRRLLMRAMYPSH